MVNGFLIILILMAAAIGLADGFIGIEILDKLKRIEKTQDYLEFNLKYSLDQFQNTLKEYKGNIKEFENILRMYEDDLK